jgi:hypothetical protein
MHCSKYGVVLDFDGNTYRRQEEILTAESEMLKWVDERKNGVEKFPPFNIRHIDKDI